jgi:carbon storage regulator
MLVLTRKKSEMIQIGENIVIKVIHAGQHTVKIGIEAPGEVRILRAELCDPPEAGHPLAAFLKEREMIRTGGYTESRPRNRLADVLPKPK